MWNPSLISKWSRCSVIQKKSISKKERVIIMNNTYLMRSLMFVPAHNQKLLDSAVRRDADVLLLDIEDSVPFAENSFP